MRKMLENDQASVEAEGWLDLLAVIDGWSSRHA